MSCAPLLKAAKPVRAKLLVRLACRVENIEIEHVNVDNSFDLAVADESKYRQMPGPYRRLKCTRTINANRANV